MRRVVITGMGAVTPAGLPVDSLWESARLGRPHFTPLSNYFDPKDVGVKLVSAIEDWDPAAFGIGKKDARRMDRYCQFALAAAKQAMADAGSLSDLDPYRVGVIIGSGIGGCDTIQEEHRKMLEKGPGKVSVFFVPMMIANMAPGTVAMEFGYKGANFAAVTACASGTTAIGEAFHAIKNNYLDAALAGGAEATISLLPIAGFDNMKTLCTGEDPNRLSIPFDKERGGFVIGEGSGILVLEELEHAKARGAKIYAEVVGYGATADAYHMTSPDPEGKGTAKAMEFALSEAGVAPEAVDYINAHGTSTHLNDLVETAAIKRVFGEHAYRLAVSSTKSVTGHMLGAAGGVEAILTAKALQEGILPPTANLEVPDEECDLDYIPKMAREKQAVYALSNSLGFGGQNAALLLKHWEE